MWAWFKRRRRWQQVAIVLLLLTPFGALSKDDKRPATPRDVSINPIRSPFHENVSANVTLPAETLTVETLPEATSPVETFLADTMAPEAVPECFDTEYLNSDGVCVHRPVEAETPPPGASAKCYDGAYSFSVHRRGTCSHHGGVAQWL